MFASNRKTIWAALLLGLALPAALAHGPAVHNLEVSGGRGTVVGQKSAFTVLESTQGADLNGDGDATDWIVHTIE
jgi:hypothetical protein